MYTIFTGSEASMRTLAADRQIAALDPSTLQFHNLVQPEDIFIIEPEAGSTVSWKLSCSVDYRAVAKDKGLMLG